MIIEKLRSGSQKLGLNLSESQFEALEKYVDCVLDFNKSYNLMKADSREEMAVNHILDSLAALPHIKALNLQGNKLGDIGSGGGCPGIPLAVCLPDFSVTLVERMEKRCSFLIQAVNALKLENVKVLCLQADKVEKESFDIEVFRAFHPFDAKIAKLLLGMVKKGGYIAAYKARSEKIESEMQGVKDIIPSYKKIALTVPYLEDHERNLVLIQKQN